MFFRLGLSFLVLPGLSASCAASGDAKSPLEVRDLTEAAAAVGDADFVGALECGASGAAAFDTTHRFRFWTLTPTEDRALHVFLDATDQATDPVLGVYSPSRGLSGINDDCNGWTRNSCVENLYADSTETLVIVASTYDRSSQGGVAVRVECTAATTGCRSQGCEGEICSAEALDELTCSGSAPPWQECVALAQCEAARNGSCEWAIPPGGPAHECFKTQELCVFEEDCGTEEVCLRETHESGPIAYGHCVPRGTEARQEGDLCNHGFLCDVGLVCTGAPRGVDANGVCRDATTSEGEGQECSAERPCPGALLCAGLLHGAPGTCVPDWMAATFEFDGFPIEIPDGSDIGVERSLVVRGLGPEPADIALSLDIVHEYVGDLRIFLADPDGTTVAVWEREGGAQPNLLLDAVPVDGFNGEANGRWTLTVIDAVTRDTGSVEGAQLYITTRPR